MTTAIAEQGILDVFEPPYHRPSLFRFGQIYCGCCTTTEFDGYGAINNGHNACHGRNPRGLGCECLPMALTLNHVTYHLRNLGFPDDYERGRKCWCCGDTAHVCGAAKRGHANTPEHQADKLANYWLPRVFRVWPKDRHRVLRAYIDTMARYWGVADLIAGDS